MFIDGVTMSWICGIAPGGVLAPPPDSPSIRFSPAASRSLACLWNAVFDIRSWNAICSRKSRTSLRSHGDELLLQG